MRKQPGTLRVVADFAKLDAVLYPGESVPIPEVLIGFVEGDQYEASNPLRRFIREEILPTLNGNRYLPPVYYLTWWGNRGWGWGEAEMYAEMEGAVKPKTTKRMRPLTFAAAHAIVTDVNMI